MRIPISPLSQNDPRWSNLKLGVSSFSVGSWGCCLTAACMAAQAFGKNVTPDMVAENEGVFQPDGNLMWLPLCKALGIDFGFRMDTTVNALKYHSVFEETAVRRHIDFLADLGIPTMCLVDTNNDGEPNHWVLYVGEGECIDPWDGKVKDLDATFHSLYGVSILNGTPVLTGGKLAALVGKANEVAHNRKTVENAAEIMQIINRA